MTHIKIESIGGGDPSAIGDGLVGTPSLAFLADPDTGLYRIGDNNIGISLGGTLVYDFSATALTISTDLFITREAAAVLQLGLDAAGVTNQMFKGPDRITSDGVGGDLTIAAGRNRGASAGGSIIFQTSPAALATVTGTLATVLTLDSTKMATFAGAIALPVVTKVNTDSAYTVLATDFTIICNAVSGAIIVNLPDATGSGRILEIKKTDVSANLVTPTGVGGSVIDGAATITLTAQYEAVTLQDTATDVWSIL